MRRRGGGGYKWRNIWRRWSPSIPPSISRSLRSNEENDSTPTHLLNDGTLGRSGGRWITLQSRDPRRHRRSAGGRLGHVIIIIIIIGCGLKLYVPPWLAVPRV